LVYRLVTGRQPGFDSQLGKGLFISISSRRSSRAYAAVAGDSFCPGVKRQEREPDHAPVPRLILVWPYFDHHICFRG
jgi:hypothetical protein